MSQTKKVVIDVGAEEYSILEAMSGNGSAEDFVKSLIKREITAHSLKNGYAEMAQLNLELAQECFEAEENDFLKYEKEL